jgi:uncharacterized membrane protein
LKSKFPFVSILIVLFWFLPVILSGTDFSSCKIGAPGYTITSYTADISLNGQGDMTVRESFVFLFPEGNMYQERFRDIGYSKNNPYSKTYQVPTNRAVFDTNSVSVSVKRNDVTLTNQEYEVGYSFEGDRDKNHEPIECPSGYGECESIYVYVPQGFSQKMQFDYTWTIDGAVTEYKDIAELNWVLYDHPETTIESAEITIHVPGAAQDEIYAFGHGTNGNIDISAEKTVLTAKNMGMRDLLEFRVLMPADLFTVRSGNFIDRNMFNEIMTYERNANLFSLIIFYGMFALVLVMILVIIYVYRKYDREYPPHFTGKYYRELPADYTPVEMSYLYYFRKINDEDVTATLLDLVRRKYLFLDNNSSGINDKNPDFMIRINPAKSIEDLKPHERQLIHWFIQTVGDNGRVTLKQIENYTKGSYQNAIRFNEEAKQFVLKAKEAGCSHDFFVSESVKSRAYAWVLVPIVYLIFSLLSGGYYGISSLVPIIVSAAVIIVYAVYVASIKRRSIKGNEDYVKWKAFREFLLDFSNMKDYPMPGIVVWEHYLVYATSLKIADKVMQQLEVKLPQIEEAGTEGATFMGYYGTHMGFYYGFALGRINRTMSAARQNGMTTIANYQAAQIGRGVGRFGGGRGGGIGGGRSFGGGGGGGRIR